MKVRSAIARTLGAAMAAGTLAWLAMVGAPYPAGGETAAVEAVADEAPGYAIEDFNYPQADKILSEQGITLKRGDGHIVLAECGSEAGLLQVLARSQSKPICFRFTGNSGWLTLEIPSVHGIRGNDYTTEVNMTVEGEEKSFDVNKNAWTQVGEAADPEGREHMLVEIRSSK
ncbi:hypothetical protein [Streptomyces spongiicola]|nr:hypothetical protein [Streptomyces spongiicola]